jgi:type IV pilus assembly protein PilV
MSMFPALRPFGSPARQRTVRRKASPRLAAAKGFTLIEVLVSFAIFAFAMLGAAGLQVWSLKSSKYSSNMAVAAALIRDYGDIMKAMPVEYGSTLSGAPASPYLLAATTHTEIKALASGTSASACFAGTACTPAQFADSAVRDWLKRADKALPQVKVAVCVDSSPADATGNYTWDCDSTGKLVMIKMRWFESDTSAATGNTVVKQTGTAPPLVVVSTTGVIDDWFKNNKF